MYCILYNTKHLQTKIYWSTSVQCTVQYTILHTYKPNYTGVQLYNVLYTIQYYTLTNPIILEFNCTMYCILYNTTHLQTQLYWSTIVQYTVHYTILHTYKPNYTGVKLYNVLYTYNTKHLQTQLYWSTTVQCIVYYTIIHTYKPN